MWLRVSLKPFALSAVASVLTFGCGGSEQNQDRPFVKPKLGLPQGFFLASENCQDQSTGVSVLGETELTLWTAGRLETQKVDFAGVTSAPHLRSDLISVVLQGVSEESVKTCLTTNEADCTNKVVSQDLGKPLKICDASGVYARNSVEAAGLASIYGFSKAARYYASLPAEIKMPMPMANLVVLPLFKIKEVQSGGQGSIRSGVRTDNAVWAKSDSSDFYFFIFPTGVKAQKLSFSQPNYWEIPFVLSHEFGHHVFFQHYPNATFETTGTVPNRSENVSLSIIETMPKEAWSDSDFLSQRFVRASSLSSLAADSRSVTNRNVLTALNEGFSDLYAFYANGAVPDLIKNVQCLSGARDVLGANFVSSLSAGQGPSANSDSSNVLAKKDLSNSALGTFFSSLHENMTEENSNCDMPSFQDEHAIGAIFAHIFNELVAEKFPDVTTTKRLETLLLWVKNLDAARRDVAGNPTEISPQNFLKLGFREAIKVTTQDGKSLSKTQCEKIKNSLSAYATEFLTGPSAAFDCKP